MSTTWYSDVPPEPPTPLDGVGRWRVLRRAVPTIVTMALLFVVMLLSRPVERFAFGLRRPITPILTLSFFRLARFFMGFQVVVKGEPSRLPGIVVANHSSWLDIVLLHQAQNVFFVSKAEVESWPGIGFVAGVAGTLFIRRNRSEARNHAGAMEERLGAGQKLVIFPEGTSSDGLRILPFRSSLFQALLAAEQSRPGLFVQPVTIAYHAPEGQEPRFYGWWGDMDFGENIVKLLRIPRQGKIHLTYHPPVAVADFENRKALARRCEDVVRSGFPGAYGSCADT